MNEPPDVTHAEGAQHSTNILLETIEIEVISTSQRAGMTNKGGQSQHNPPRLAVAPQSQRSILTLQKAPEVVRPGFNAGSREVGAVP